jgi:methionyl-tRNA synthetase
VADVLRDLESRGENYKASYEGWYCTPCESFWTDLQLKEGKCPDCSREVQKLSEENYFFKMSKHQDWLRKEIEEGRIRVHPDYRKNEILGFLRQPLEDLSITRPKSRLGWGIDYPNSAEHVVYVWFDALINYVSVTRYPEVMQNWGAALWPADLHVVGKDILRQHAVYWPIMLRAMELNMPKTILAHGWWTMSGAKVSKSRGNAVDPIELTKKYGVDAFRYFLLHEVTLGMDGAFSEDLLAERYTTDLANDLGNLFFRVASMLEKYFDKKIPESGYRQGAYFAPVFRSAAAFMENYDPKKALECIWPLFVQSNQAIDEKKPWVMAKDPSQKEELAKFLTLLADRLAHAAYLLLPFLPATAEKILQGLHLPADRRFSSADEFEGPLVKPGLLIERGEALFPRLEEKV